MHIRKSREGLPVRADLPVRIRQQEVFMAFVSVPKDLAKVKNKVVFNMTRRQIICLGAAAAVGLPFYFLARGAVGTSNAASGMVVRMLPAFMFAMYEKDGLPLEKILFNIINVKFARPAVRRYENGNLYEGRKAGEAGKGGRRIAGKKEKWDEIRDRGKEGREGEDFRAGLHPLPGNGEGRRLPGA